MARTSNSRDGTFRLIGIALLLLVICVLSPAFARFYTELLWFQSLDLAAVFTRQITAVVGLVASAGVASVVFLVFNWALVPHWIVPTPHIIRQIPATPGRGGQPARQVEVSTRPLRLIFAAGAVAVGIILGLTYKGLWQTYLLPSTACPMA